MAKEKVIEFIEKGSLDPEDEITRGNGYWFQIKEKELLEKHLFNDVPMPFNPIAEAPDILTAPGSEEIMPNDEDLDYPDEGSATNSTAVIDVGEIFNDKNDDNENDQTGQGDESSKQEEVHLPSDLDLDYPDTGESLALEEKVDEKVPELPEEKKASSISKKKRREVNSVANSHDDGSKKSGQTKRVMSHTSHIPHHQGEVRAKSMSVKAPERNDRYLFYLLGLIVFIIIGVLFYYKKIINKPLPMVEEITVENFLPISNAHGQVLLADKKKASSITLV